MVTFSKTTSITYPQVLRKYDWQLKLWKHLFCSRNWHLFDLLTIWQKENTWKSYLYCDACEFQIDIIDTYE